VDAPARPPPDPQSIPSSLHRLASGLRSAAPLLVLGVARLAATRATGYQHHVSEYGVHWNFFLTVAAISLLTLAARIPSQMLLPVGLLVAAAHQAALSLGGLGAWAHAEARGPGWVSLNKEGLVSIAGYWSISLLGAACGKYLCAGCNAGAAKARGALSGAGKRGGGGAGGGAAGAGGGVGATSQGVWAWVARLLLLDLAVWAAAFIVEATVEPVSRR
jgi:phosphatidylinositol glycan class W